MESSRSHEKNRQGAKGLGLYGEFCVLQGCCWRVGEPMIITMGISILVLIVAVGVLFAGYADLLDEIESIKATHRLHAHYMDRDPVRTGPPNLHLSEDDPICWIR